ncbi:type VII secretion protein EccB [Actinomadura pelletieri DSM 43383]|uniref:Type VII secretion protein EccB n=1 Tax=Actinomadura pelletieri DSM 43383 TaxID=1120940 RepID=A0A495QGZ4_9ACTN|nr:type VII secretion protein EccB [Actinomadura pelletieri]RKS71118.1 type VII secretion protein EccB [Actinomadura pelletieri DSM 43383]
MQTRKDLLQAHRLMSQRASLALISGEPDNPELPMRRMNIAAFSGIMIGILCMAAFGIYGVIRPGGATGLEKAGMLIVEEETGARYVWCENGRLCPVSNYVSARLVAGENSDSRRTVSTASLKKFERGPTLGIPGAPNTLPEPDELTRGPWAVCVRTVESTSLGRRSLVTLTAERKVGGTPLTDGQALVVTADGHHWLLWRNSRMRIPPYGLATLGATPVQIAGKWLNSVTQGPDFAAPKIPGIGHPVNGPAGRAKVGQIFNLSTASGASSSFVLLADGLAPISPIQRDLLVAAPETRRAYGPGGVRPIEINAGQVNTVGRSAHQLRDQRLEGRAPAIVPFGGTTPLCALYNDPSGNDGATLTLNGALPAPPETTSPQGADQIAFPPGSAALAGRVPSPGKADQVSTYYLVAEGKRFPIKDSETVGKLGYSLPGDASNVPAGVLDLIVQGPVLDPAAVSAARPTNAQAGN